MQPKPQPVPTVDVQIQQCESFIMRSERRLDAQRVAEQTQARPCVEVCCVCVCVCLCVRENVGGGAPQTDIFWGGGVTFGRRGRVQIRWSKIPKLPLFSQPWPRCVLSLLHVFQGRVAAALIRRWSAMLACSAAGVLSTLTFSLCTDYLPLLRQRK